MKKFLNITAREFVNNISKIEEDLPLEFHIDYFGTCTIDLHDLAAMEPEFDFLFDGDFVNCRFEPNKIYAELLSANFALMGDIIEPKVFMKPLIGSFRYSADLLIDDETIQMIEYFIVSQRDALN